jgi:hypothetical protein
MSLSAVDIREDDTLGVIGGEEYPIRKVSDWAWGKPSLAMKRLLKVRAYTKRAPAVSGGKVAAKVAHLTDLRCTPLDPVDAQTQARLGFDTPIQLYQTFVEGEPYLHLYVERVRAQ